jgi:leucyl-tRNA synthetase
MAYYTIAHYLQGDMNGSKPGLMDIQAKELTDAVFDYIFMQTDTPPEACSISVEKLNVRIFFLTFV